MNDPKIKGAEGEAFHTYNGSSGTWDEKKLSEFEPARQAPLKFVRDFYSSYPSLGTSCTYTGVTQERCQGLMIDEATKKTEERQSIHAIDLQPRSLKALAMDSLLKNFPNMTNLDTQTLKTIGIPANIVDEIDQHKALGNQTAPTVVDLVSESDFEDL